MIAFDDIFVVLDDKDKRGRTIFRLAFKHTRELLPNGMTNKEENIRGLGHRWIKKNQELAGNVLFEIEVLEPRPGLEPGLPD